MTQDEIIEIIEMARQAGVDMSLGEHWSFFIEELKAFAKLVAEKERREILGLADSLGWVNIDHIQSRGQE